jgi:hypothetical protein
MNDHLSTETLIDYLHGELDPASDSRVYQHVAACAACTSELNRERALGEVLRAAAARDEREFPAALRESIREAARAQSSRPLQWFRTLVRPVVALPIGAAAAAAFALYFAGPLSPLDSAHGVPAIAASYYIERHEAQQLQNPLAERSMPAPTMETVYEAPAQSETADLATEAAVAPGTLDVVR